MFCFYGFGLRVRYHISNSIPDLLQYHISLNTRSPTVGLDTIDAIALHTICRIAHEIAHGVALHTICRMCYHMCYRIAYALF